MKVFLLISTDIFILHTRTQQHRTPHNINTMNLQATIMIQAQAYTTIQIHSITIIVKLLHTSIGMLNLVRICWHHKQTV